MCPLMIPYRKEASYDIYGQVLSYELGYLCQLNKNECIHCTKVTIINKNQQTDVTRSRPDGSELLILDHQGKVARHGIQII